jgi:hypothetical protein
MSACGTKRTCRMDSASLQFSMRRRFVANRSFDLERDWSAMRAKNICRAGILSVVDFAAEEKRARTCTYIQHPCTRLLIMELPRLAIRDQIDN